MEAVASGALAMISHRFVSVRIDPIQREGLGNSRVVEAR